VNLLNGFFNIVNLIGLALFVLGVFTFIDAAIRQPGAFVAAGKLTKGAWMAITGLSAAALLLFGFRSLLGLPAIVAVLVYLVDVRPAVRGVSGPRPPRASSW
jgi:hypothetical protein